MIADRFRTILDFYERELPIQRAEYSPAADTAELERLPPQLVPLFELCNGTGSSGGFFGNDLLSVAGLEASRSEWELIIASSDDPDGDYHDVIESRSPDAVSALYWKTGWVPFSVDGGGNGFALDLAPEPGGTIGQIINYGPDEDYRVVVADSLESFFDKIVALLDAGAAVVDRDAGWVNFVVDGRETHLLTALRA
ncbi:SMI1/KNR4 family protein [Antrihabitans cavernicola]|uniref:SMI1/KNR4 family protein n=1 Tax=Antrihabitans cavernicola TaxID=2495913 RepID=UPI00165923AF|nr:SMI1/KNR4 family protein [Spelaeibacter cavernicola]